MLIKAIEGAFLLFSLLWLLPGCGPSRSEFAQPGDLKSWERIVFGKSDLKAGELREVAQGESVCLKDRAGLAELASEVGRREREIATAGSPRVTLPPPFSGFQGSSAAKQYLATFAESAILRGSDVNYSGCTTLPCIINRIYGVSDTSLVGLQVYWFWLKTGYSLSTSNVVPRLTLPQGIPRGDYLFQPNELTAFWLLSHTLPAPFLRSPSLQTLYRVPRRYTFADQGVCGIASGSRQEGMIRLSDSCLSLSSQGNGILTDFFYSAVTHEIAHRIDFFLGQTGVISLSDQPEWLGFSGWQSVSVIDSTGTYQQQWRSDPAKEGFVRDYAGSSPAEDFAESAAYFRFNSEKLKRIAPQKSAYMKRTLFEDRDYSEADLWAHYLKLVSTKVASSTPGLLRKCFSEDSSATPSDLSSRPNSAEFGIAVEFLRPFHLPERTQRCIAQELLDTMKGQMDLLRRDEWEACDLFAGASSAQLIQESLVTVKNSFERDLGETEAMADILVAQRELREAIELELDPREAAIQCSYLNKSSIEALTEARECHKLAVTARFEEVGAPFANRLGLSRYQSERDLYLERNGYDRALGQVYDIYDLIFGQIQPYVRRQGGTLWKECLDDQRSEVEPVAVEKETRLIRVSGGTHYVDPVFLGCLNAGLSARVSPMVSATLSRLGLGSPSIAAMDLMANRYIARPLISQIEALIQSAASAEEESLKDLLQGASDQFLTTLLGELSWVRLRDSEETRIALCQEKFWEQFRERTQSLVEGKQWRFATPAKAVQFALEAACMSASASSVVDERVRALAAEVKSVSLQKLESDVVQLGEAAGRACKAKNPGTTRTYRERRKTCLERAWPGVLRETLEKWSRLEEVIQVFETAQVASSRGNAYLRGKSAGLLKKSIETMEK